MKHDNFDNASPYRVCDDLVFYTTRPGCESAIKHSGEAMIEPFVAIILIGFGATLALFCVFAGAVLHMRFLDRKLIPPVPKVTPITRQIPAVKP